MCYCKAYYCIWPLPTIEMMYILIMTPQPFTFLDFSEAALRTRLVFVSSVERLSMLTAHVSICSGH